MASTSKELVRSSFSERATEWMACYAGAEGTTLEQRNLMSRQRLALEMLDSAVRPPAKILDAGCGSGELAAKLIDRGYDAHGLDIAEPMIHFARTRFGSHRFQVGDIENIPFPDNTFDAVVCLGVVEYLDSDDQALREISRILKPAGIALLATPNANAPLHRFDQLLLSLRPKYRSATGIAHRTYRRRRWLRTLAAHGFACEKRIRNGWGWYESPLGAIAFFLSDITRSLGAEDIVLVRK